MVANLENVWMDEYDRVFEIELDNGLTNDSAEDSATKSAEMAVYYYGELKLPSLKEELRLRSLKVSGNKMISCVVFLRTTLRTVLLSVLLL